MIRPFAMLLLCAAGACAGPRPNAEAAAADACALRVEFGSYAMGIDRPALDKVRAVLAAERVTVDEQRWGREGEVTLCAAGADPGRVARKVERVLPNDPRGPITVTTVDGVRIERSRSLE